ncbi:MAG: MMPL family transporter [Candidatus Thermoplasmatota archaeon]|nr:MMPL family transporter [Candidatus Thermoplasmatota archaeon]
MQYDILLKKPKLTIIIFSIITLLISTQALNIVISSDIELYMPSDEPTVKTLNKIRAEWYIDSVIVYVSADDVTSVTTLKEIDAIEGALNPEEGIGDGVVYTASIASFLRDINAIFPVIGEDKIPDSQCRVNTLLKFIPDEMKYKFNTSDNKNAVIVLATQKNISADDLLENKVYPLLETATETNMTSTGVVTMYKETVDWVMERIYSAILISALLLVLTILAFHKSMKAVIIAITPIVYATGLTFGTIGMTSIKFSPTVIAVIPLLAALGIAYSLHLINHFAEEVEKHSPEKAMKRIIATTGKAVLLSAITTIVGFASLLSSTMPPIENMGLAFLIGVFYCFIATMVMVPPLLIISGYKRRGIKGWSSFSKLTKYRKHIALVFLVLTFLSVAALPSVSTRTSIWEMMPGKMESSVAMTDYSEKFESGQTGVFEIETGPEGILEPSLLKELESLEKTINVGIKNASAYSIVDAIKKLNFGVIPPTKEEVKVLVENRLADKYKKMMLNDDYSKTLVYVDIPVISIGDTRKAVNGVDQILRQYNDKTDADITELVGLASVTVSVNDMLMEQQFRFMFLSLLLVFTCLLLVFRSFKYATVTFLPILLILVWEPGVLVLTGIPLNVATIMVSSVAIGAGIDFSVHITERVRDELKNKTALEAIKTAISTKSPSLVEATIALIAGGIPIFLMEYEMITQFIILVLMMLVFACVASLLGLAAIYSIKNGKWLESWGR